MHSKLISANHSKENNKTQITNSFPTEEKVTCKRRPIVGAVILQQVFSNIIIHGLPLQHMLKYLAFRYNGFPQYRIFHLPTKLALFGESTKDGGSALA